jgi:DNA-binding CsgD family transcriptional regulator
MNHIDKIIPRLIRVGITTRQIIYLDFMLKGMSVKAIAESMCIAESSVKLHTNKLVKKLEVKSRFELIVLCFNMILEEVEKKGEVQFTPLAIKNIQSEVTDLPIGTKKFLKTNVSRYL